MSIKNIPLLVLFAAAVAFSVVWVFGAQPVQAKECGGVEVAFLECPTSNSGSNDPLEKSALWSVLTLVLNVMLGGVAVAAVGGLVYGAIMYASAQDNASQVQEAIGIIRNVVIGLVMFMLMWAGIQYLVPGGVF